MKGVAIFLSYALLVFVKGAISCKINGPLGMISGEILDWQITASSSYPNEWDEGCYVKYARPYAENKQGWCARYKTKSEWLQIDIGVLTTVSGIITQGRADGQEWVSAYMVSYSTDGLKWSYVTDGNGISRVFQGNSDSYSIQHVYLPEPVEARFIKIQVQEWNKHPSMRVELVGCSDNKQSLGQPPYGSFRASSSHHYRRRSSCQPGDGHIMSGNGWCAAQSDANQWLELNVGPPSYITALVTKGRGDTGRRWWVTRYQISYSNDTSNWTFYKDQLDAGSKYLATIDKDVYNQNEALLLYPNKVNRDGILEFGGNSDKNMPRIHYLSRPFIARYIRFHPVEWNNEISMRVGVMGHHYDGECTPGFTRPNSASPCVENIAFKKATWLNKDKHKKRELEDGYGRITTQQKLAEKAVDGITVDDIRSCTILDNYYDEQPQLNIDLGKRYDVSGIIIYTWKGDKKGDDTERYNENYAVNLDSLSVYISSDKYGEELCGKISNDEQQLLVFREHRLTCARRSNGRYIRIQPDSRPNRLYNWYSAVICEVMAYT